MTAQMGKKRAKGRTIKYLLVLVLAFQCSIFYQMIKTEARRPASAAVASRVAPFPMPATGASPQMMSFGPFVPYPITWPKMSGAILLFKDDPDIGITPEQAQRLIPCIERLDAAWETVRGASDILQRALSEAQQKYVVERQKSYQLVTLPVASTAPQGQAGPVPPVTRSYGLADGIRSMKKASKEHDAPVAPITQLYGINLWDMMHGLIDLDDNRSPIRARGQQAARIQAILESVDEPLKQAYAAEDDLRSTLTPAQIDFLVNHMPEITEKKRNAAKSIRELPVSRIKDPLLSLVMQILEAKAPKP